MQFLSWNFYQMVMKKILNLYLRKEREYEGYK